VVTGANAGIGFEVARALAARGASVVLACRNPSKGEHAAAALVRAGVSPGRLDVVALDLQSLESVRHAAGEIRARFRRVDLLINNAGVMAVPFALSDDGIELTFATNHLGHFAFTALVLDRLLAAPGSRVVTVSSNAHRRAAPTFGDLRSGDGYEPGPAYERSKLANLLFTFELQRRLTAANAATLATAAHPGNARTALWRTSSWLERVLVGPFLSPLTGRLVQSAAQGARPIVCAATDPSCRGGEYYGPGGWRELTGSPRRVEVSEAAHDRAAQRRLWQLSEELAQIAFPLPEPPVGSA
jgi:NAD(P)-dependent dehydrogenase (short-subunit alcohol dehydrogenase family)